MVRRRQVLQLAQRQEGLPSAMPPNAEGEFAEGMPMRSSRSRERRISVPDRGGMGVLRVAGTATSRHYGDTPELLAYYEWFAD